MRPDDEPFHRPESVRSRARRVDALLEALLQEDDYRRVLERLCLAHPDLAEEIRRRVERLEAHGVLGAAQRTRLPTIGERCGPYELVGVLGRGAMGVVFRARGPVNGDTREVALKIIQPGLSESARARFEREALALQELQHPNLCRLIAVGESSNVPWLALELIEGRSLAEKIQAEREDLDAEPAIAGATQLVSALARGLALAHAKGIVHRDVKPANILLREDGAPVLIDFGLVHFGDLPRLTAANLPIGTPAYMAPEQVRGQPVRPQSDVYALGAVLYEILTRRPPFESASREDLFRQILVDDAESPRRRNPALPAPLANVILKCLEKDARRRYLDAGELADDLDRFLNGRTVLARPAGWVRVFGRRVRRHPASALGVCFVALVLLAAVLLAQNSRLAARALAGSMLSSLYSKRYGEQEALTVAARAFDTHQDLRTRSQLYRLWIDQRVGARWSTASHDWVHGAVSPDGRTLAVAAAPEQDELFHWLAGDESGGQPFPRCLVSTGAHVQWSPDGELLAVADGKKDIRVITVGAELTAAEYRLRERVPSRSFLMPARSIVFDANGGLWVGTEEGQVHRLRAGAVEPFRVFGRNHDVLALDVEGEHLIAASRQGELAVLNRDGLVLARPLTTKSLESAGVRGNDCDRLLLDLETRRLLLARDIDASTKSGECQLELWGLPSAGAILTEPARLLAGPFDLRDRTIDLALADLDDDGRVEVAALTRRSDIWIGDVQHMTRIALDVGAGFSAAFHDGRVVVTTTEGEVLVLALDGNVLAHVAACADSIPLVVPSADDGQVIALCRDGSSVAIGLRSEHAPIIRPDGDEVYAAKWVSRSRLITATSPHRFALWDRTGGLALERRLNDSPGLHRLAVSGENGVVAVAVEGGGYGFLGGQPSAIRWLEPMTLEALSLSPGKAGAPRWRDIEFTPDAATLYAVDGRRLVRLTRRVDGKGWDEREIAREDSRFSFEHVAVAEGGIASSGTDGRIESWSRDGTATGRVRFDVAPTALAASGSELFAGFQDGSLRVLRLPDLSLVRELEPHPRRVTAIAVRRMLQPERPSSISVGIGSSGGLVSVHLGRAQERWLEFDAEAGIMDLDWNPEAEELLVTTSTKRVRVLPDLAEETLRRRARDCANR